MIDQDDQMIRLEATRAMFYTVLLAEDQFRDPALRTNLMEIVIKAIMDPNVEIQKCGLEVLTKIVERYYDFVAQYMEVRRRPRSSSGTRIAVTTELSVPPRRIVVGSLCVNSIFSWSTKVGRGSSSTR